MRRVPKKPAAFARKLGARIAELRAERGLTQEKLAWEAGFASKGYLSRIESGERLPSLEVLLRVAGRLEVEPRDLLVFPADDKTTAAIERLRLDGEKLAAKVLALSPAKPPLS